MSDSFVGFRLTSEELSLLDSQAESYGLSRSGFLRFLIAMGPELVEYSAVLDADRGRVVAFPIVPLVDVTAMKNELRKQGVNLNQSVRSLNTISRSLGSRKTEELLAMFASIQKELHAVAEGYDRFDERFAEFCASVKLLDGAGNVRSEKH